MDRAPVPAVAQPHARSRRVAVAVILGFVLIGTMNAGGYRFGISDQAFYVPAINHHLDPQLFPRDWPMLAAQDRLNVFTIATAALLRTTGLPLPLVFLALQLVTMALLAVALFTLGRTLSHSAWTAVALVAAGTLDHAIAQGAVNTLEGYFHPRLLAFALGAGSLLLFLRGRSALSLAGVALAALIHPTTSGWFLIWLGAALVFVDPRRRWPYAAGALAGAACVVLWVCGSGRAAVLSPMDADWLAVLASRTYLFPDRWPVAAWILACAYPTTIILASLARRRAGVSTAREHAVVKAALALFAILLAAMPFIGWRSALIVRLQIPRVLWLLDLLAIALLVWWLAEGRSSERDGRASCRRPRTVALALVALAVARGSYVAFIEHPGRPIVQVALAPDQWTDAMAWLARTPRHTHVLADPRHAWKYGSSVRVAASRDVFHEQGKDAAFALYSRETALRVAARIGEIGDFDQLTAARARELAMAHDLDYLVTEQTLDLPVAYRNARFTIYALRR